MDIPSASLVNVAELDGPAVIALYSEAEHQASSLLRQRTVAKLAATLIADIKADGPPPLPSNEHQARELLATLGRQLDQAAASLHWAAERLKLKGDASGAGHVHEAALRTKAAAQGVT